MLFKGFLLKPYIGFCLLITILLLGLKKGGGRTTLHVKKENNFISVVILNTIFILMDTLEILSACAAYYGK